MLRHLEQTRTDVYRLVGIASFVIFMALSAKVTLEIGNLVPFTLQVMVVLLAGLVLGGRDAALSMAGYVGLIALGAPLDARGLGSAALFGPTGGYLLGFIAAAGLVGLLVEAYDHRAGLEAPTRREQITRWLARYGMTVPGIAVIYLFGIRVLQLQAGLDFPTAWAIGGQPFWWLDLCKAAVAVSLAEGGREALQRLRSGLMM